MAISAQGNGLFSATQQKVLGLLYGKPDQSFYANEIVRWVASGKGSVMRELERLLAAGILTMTRQGNQTRYQANPRSPIYNELLGIVRKTFGMGEQIRLALQPFAEQLVWAFIYGSIAKGGAHAGSDVDLMLIGSDLNYGELMEQLMPVEESIGRPINPTLSTLEDWASKSASGNSFVLRIGQQEKINLIGHDPLESKDGHK
jgi:predicted nucleotidyltransferase